jgi:hypothetical protein
MPQGGLRYVYIDQRVEREPLDQTDLRNDVDAILGGGGGTFWKVLMSGAHRGPGGTMVGPANPTWRPLRVCLRGVAS